MIKKNLLSAESGRRHQELIVQINHVALIFNTRLIKKTFWTLAIDGGYST